MRRALAIGLVLAAGVAVSGCAAGFAGSPTYVTDISATINGLVATTDGGSTPYWVEYGTDTSYDHQSAHRTRTVPAKSSFLVSIPIAGLSPSTTYHYRVCSERCSDDATFTTDSRGGRSGIAFVGAGPGSPFTSSDVFVMDRDGANPTNLTNSSTSEDGWPAWSPDGRQIAYAYLQFDSSDDIVGSEQIYAINANGSNKHPLTSDAAHHFQPAWSPDGKRIAFTRVLTSGNADIYAMDADGANQVNLTKTSGAESNPAWSPDGTRIAYTYAPDANSLGEIYVMNADGSHRTPLTQNNLFDDDPTWSPDGARIAFTRRIAGTLAHEIFAMGSDGANQVDLTNRNGSQSGAAWSADGTSIAFDEADDIFTMGLPTGTPVDIRGSAGEPAWSPRP